MNLDKKNYEINQSNISCLTNSGLRTIIKKGKDAYKSHLGNNVKSIKKLLTKIVGLQEPNQVILKNLNTQNIQAKNQPTVPNVIQMPGTESSTMEVLQDIREISDPLPPEVASLSDEFFDNGYILSDGHLETITKNGPERVANFVMFTEKVTEYRTSAGANKKMFDVVAYDHLGNKYGPSSCSEADLRNIKKMITALGGTNLYVAPAVGAATKYVEQAFKMLSRGASKHTCFSQLGWQSCGGKLVYLSSSGVVTNAEQNISVDISEAGKLQDFFALPLEVSTDQVKIGVRQFLTLDEIASDTVMLPLMAAQVTAPLLEVFGQAKQSTAFTMVLHGRTGSFKTTLAKLVASMNGGTGYSRSGNPASFSGTLNATEQILSIPKDALMIIDDYHPSSASANIQKNRGLVQELISRIANQDGRSRMTPCAGLRETNIPRCLALMTSEMKFTGESTLGRIVEIPIRKSDINTELLTVAQKNMDILPAAMTGYIRYISDNMDSITADIATNFKAIREKFSGEVDIHAQIPTHLAALEFGLETFLRFAQSKGVITAEKAVEIIDRLRQALVINAKKQMASFGEDDPVRGYLNALVTLLSTGEVFVEKLATTDKLPLELQKKGRPIRRKSIGWYSNERLYLLPEDTDRVVNRHLGAASRSGLGARDIRRLMADIDILIPDARGNNTNQIRYKNSKVQVIKLDYSVIKQYLDGDVEQVA